MTSMPTKNKKQQLKKSTKVSTFQIIRIKLTEEDRANNTLLIKICIYVYLYIYVCIYGCLCVYIDIYSVIGWKLKLG